MSAAKAPAPIRATWDGVRDEYRKLVRLGWDAVAQAARVGALLAELRETTPHGEWDANVNRVLQMKAARQTAHNLMRLAAHRPLLERHRPESQRAALALIKAEAAPPEAKREPAPKPKALPPRPEPAAVDEADPDLRKLARVWNAAAPAVRDAFIRKVHASFDTEIRAEIERRLPDRKKRYDELEAELNLERARLQAARAGVERFLTQDDYRLVLGCLHPDKPDRDAGRLARAFEIVQRLEAHVDANAGLRELKRAGWYLDLGYDAFRRRAAKAAT